MIAKNSTHTKSSCQFIASERNLTHVTASVRCHTNHNEETVKITSNMVDTPKKRKSDDVDNESDTLCPDDFEQLDEIQQRKLIYSKLIELDYSNKKVIKEISRDIGDLKVKVSKLEKENHELRLEINFIQQVNLNNSLVVYGVPKSNNIDDISIVQRIAAKLDIQVLRQDISETFRLRVKSGEDHPPLVVKFVRRSQRTELIEKKKKKNLKTSDIDLEGDSKRIFLNEYLSKNNTELLKYAKTLKEHNYKYIWPSGGRILAKKKEGDKPIIIPDRAKVDELLGKENGQNNPEIQEIQ